MRVLVVGGGIGGLTAAIALRRRGVDVEVLEARPALSELGAGLTLWPNALAGLARLDLAEAVAAEGHAIRWMQVRRSDGRPLSDIDTDRINARLGHPSIGITRPRLHDVLVAAARAADIPIRVDARCVGVETTPHGATVRLEGRDEVSADIVVGADGLNSVVRQHLHDDAPTYAGYLAWRAVCDTPPPSDLPDSVVWRGPEQIAGVVRQPQGSFWFATKTAPHGAYEHAQGQVAALALFGTWDRPLVELIASTPPEAIHRDHLYDRPPRWGRGPVTLLGDAAHPMRPSLGQGACQAIEDAVTLAETLADGRAEPLRRYEAARRRRVARIVRFSRWVAASEQLRQPLLGRLSDASFAVAPTRSTTAIFERLASTRGYP